MDAVVIDPPEEVLARRKALGLDIRDEVWDGEYHMVPAASNEHQRMERRLERALEPLYEAVGLEILHECNLIPADEPGWRQFRVPDLVAFGPEQDVERAVAGAAALVVEFRSPGDESYQKLPYYEQLGVEEILIIDRDTKVVRHWRNTEQGLVESEPDERGRLAMVKVPAELWCEDGRLHVAVDDDVTTI